MVLGGCRWVAVSPNLRKGPQKSSAMSGFLLMALKSVSRLTAVSLKPSEGATL